MPEESCALSSILHYFTRCTKTIIPASRTVNTAFLILFVWGFRLFYLTGVRPNLTRYQMMKGKLSLGQLFTLKIVSQFFGQI